QPRFAVAFQLGQIEIGSRSTLQQDPAVAKEVQAEVEQRCRNGSARDREVLFRQMPPAWTHEQRSRMRSQLVHPPLGGAPADVAEVCVAQIPLPLNAVAPRRRV